MPFGGRLINGIEGAHGGSAAFDDDVLDQLAVGFGGFDSIGGIAPGETVKDYIKGSYGFDPKGGVDGKGGSASVMSSKTVPSASLKVLGGPRGSLIRVRKTKFDPNRKVVEDDHLDLKTEAGKTRSISPGMPPSEVEAGFERHFTVFLLDTFYTPEVVPPPTPPLPPLPVEEYIAPTPKKFEFGMNLPTIGIVVGIIAAIGIGAAVAMKKK
ncbi:MAG: hypothetical protein A2W25_04120 [candidate division Zixibacteria bacterium RBG_16_53_22]|nr:MAG: hypothetical protein A2W25_04120 [candidate division Zixibacteria bacterium RBG_16_53_22]